MPMQNMSKDLKAHLYTRISNPFFSYFAISWFLVNWKFFVVIFIGKENPIIRIQYIDQNIEINNIYPFVMATILVFIWPMVNKYIITYWEWNQSNLINIRKKYSQRELLTVDESIRIKEEIVIQKKKYTDLLRDQDRTIQEYNKVTSILSNEQLEEIDEIDEDEESPAFMKPLRPSAALAKIVGETPLPRTEVVKKVWAYIRKNNLQDAKNLRNINADEILKPIFEGKNQVSMFELTKYLSKNLSD